MDVYGAPKVFMRLKTSGVATSRKRVARIMRGSGWKGVAGACAKRPPARSVPPSRTPMAAWSSATSAPTAPTRPGPQASPTCARQGWPCLAVAMDAWPRIAVGWAMGPRTAAGLAGGALKMAIARREPAEGCIHHSDRGARYASLPLGEAMREDGIRPSMGPMSSPWDDAVAELPMGIIKSERAHARTFDGGEQATPIPFDCIERFYSRLRIHSALDDMTRTEGVELISGSEPQGDLP